MVTLNKSTSSPWYQAGSTTTASSQVNAYVLEQVSTNDVLWSIVSTQILSNKSIRENFLVLPSLSVICLTCCYAFSFSLPEMFKKVLQFTMTPGGIDTAKLYPILMSSGLPREALGQIWASANRTTPGMLTKEELYTVLALIGVAQVGICITLHFLKGQSN